MSEELSDSELVKMAQADPEHFGLIYERYLTRIYNYIYYRTGNTQDAEDLTARVFMRAMNHIQNYKDRGLPFSAWLYRIAHNLVANWHRDNSRRKTVSIDAALSHSIPTDVPEFIQEAAENQDMLLDAIRELPAERQQLLILKFVEHLSNAEIGDIMNRSEGAIKSLYHRTLLALRDQILRNQNNLNIN